MKSRFMPLLLSAALLVFTGSLAWAGACVDVELAFEPTTVSPFDEVQVFASLENTGDEAGTVELAVTVTFMGQEYGPYLAETVLAAGEEISAEVPFTVPPALAGGTLTIHVEATAGACTDTAVASLEVLGDGLPGSAAEPIGALAGDLLDGFGAGEDTEITWGAVKSRYGR